MIRRCTSFGTRNITLTLSMLQSLVTIMHHSIAYSAYGACEGNR